MNETLQTIYNRRSIRSYRPDPVGGAEIGELMKAAINAPNAGNRQFWHFTAIQDESVLKLLKATMKTNMQNSGIEFMAKRASEPGFVPFFNAPALIILTADEKNRWGDIDCACAAENICLAAESIGIGTCLMTSSEMLFTADASGELKSMLGIPAGYRHVCAITLGYKEGENPTAKPRKQDAITLIL